MTRLVQGAFAVFSSCLSLAVCAEVLSPVGAWTTIDDETKKPKSLVRISEKDGVYTGTIEKIFDPAKQDSKCDECAADDPRRGKPVIGMTILSGLKHTSDSVYAGGTVLDPANGKTYNAKVTVIDGGKKLEMRGSFLFIGRTQTWLRAD
ncbi:MAG: DUF2147 domain-containing protein [Betaproteobacteria bacterium]|nr:DUF2147 domain-containing protein [Betaproteobacteria bacterium]